MPLKPFYKKHLPGLAQRSRPILAITCMVCVLVQAVLWGLELPGTLKRINLESGFKLGGNLDTFRYLSCEFKTNDSVWKFGYNNESSILGWVGHFQEYRVYAHRYASYGFLPQWDDAIWFLGLSVADSEFTVPSISPELGFRSLQPLQLWFVPLSYSESLSLYTDAIQCETNLEILVLPRPFGWPLDIAAEATHLWFGPFTSHTSSSLGLGVGVKLHMNDAEK